LMPLPELQGAEAQLLAIFDRVAESRQRAG
jgi:hypothetical protein